MHDESVLLRAVVIDDTPYLAVADVVSTLSIIADATDAAGGCSEPTRVAIGNLLALGLQSLAASG